MLRYVTLTGSDERTSFAKMKALSRKYLLVEWGILYDPALMGTPRYPSLAWIEDFVAKANRAEMNVCLHFCGDAISQLNDDLKLQGLARKVGRIQLNVRESHIAAIGQGFANLVRKVHAADRHTKVIFQLNEESNSICQQISAEYGVEFSLDNSKGQGISPAEWPDIATHADGYRIRSPGFAGGIGPDNLEATLEILEKKSANKPYWVDMETKLRNEKDEFCLTRCESVLALAMAHSRACQVEAGKLWGKGTRDVRKLDGLWLDFWVAMAVRIRDNQVIPPERAVAVMRLDRQAGSYFRFSPSENDYLSTDLFEEELIALTPKGPRKWEGRATDCDLVAPGNNMVKAGLRAIVLKHFGEKVPKNPGLFF